MFKNIGLFLLTFLIIPTSQAFLDLTYMKFSYRLANGIFYQTNTLLAQGTSITYLSPDLSLYYFWDPKHAVGLGGDVYFNYSLGTIAIYGIRGSYRWYFKGLGHPKLSNHNFLKISSTTSYALYAGTSLRKYEYYLGGNSSDESTYEQRGSFFDVNLCTGLDYRIGKETEINVELNFSVLALASSDDRIRMGNALFLFGIAHWW